MLKKKVVIRTAIKTTSYLETGQIVVFESGRLKTQKDLVQWRQCVLRSVPFSVNLIRNHTLLSVE